LVDYQARHQLTVNGTANVETVTHLNKMLKILGTMSTTTAAGDTKTKDVKTTPSFVTVPSTVDTKPIATTNKSTSPITSSNWNVDKATTTTTPKDKPAPIAKTKDESDPYYRPIIHNKLDPQTIVSYLLKKNLKWNNVQGIILNMSFESGFDSGSYVMHDTKASKGTPEYLRAGPSGGLCHWHDAFEAGKDKNGNDTGVRRLTAMINACGGEGNWQKNWEQQIDFLLSEPPSKTYIAKTFATAEEASEWFTKHWEFPADAEKEAKKRSGIRNTLFR